MKTGVENFTTAGVFRVIISFVIFKKTDKIKSGVDVTLYITGRHA